MPTGSASADLTSSLLLAPRVGVNQATVWAPALAGLRSPVRGVDLALAGELLGRVSRSQRLATSGSRRLLSCGLSSFRVALAVAAP